MILPAGWTRYSPEKGAEHVHTKEAMSSGPWHAGSLCTECPAWRVAHNVDKENTVASRVRPPGPSEEPP